MSKFAILCVDDEAVVLKSLRDQLRRHLSKDYGNDYYIEVAESGEEALEIIEELSADGIEVPIIISDQIMPGMTGDELLTTIHTKHPETLKIFLTGRADADAVGNAVNHADLYRYIAKPWNEIDFNLTISEGLRSYFQDKKLAEQNVSLHYLYEQAQQEIAERKQAEAALQESQRLLLMAQQTLERRVQERTRELATLLEVSHNVAATLELTPLLDIILDQLKSVVDYSGAAIFSLVDDDLVLLAQRNWHLRTEGTGQPHIPLLKFPVDSEVLRRGEPIIIADLHHHLPESRRLQNTSEAQRQKPSADIHSWLVVPLLLKREMIGLLNLEHCEADAYSPAQANLVLTFANQVAVAIENAKLYQQAQKAAATEERHRLARELHDSVTQSLYSLTFFAEASRRLAEAGDLKEMRLLVYELRSPMLEEQGLAGILQHRLDAVEKRAGVEARLLVDGAVELPPPVEEGLYRIAQEALNNALKHASATSVTVLIRANNERVELEIVDNGCGFDPNLSRDSGGIGLASMQERADALGGVLAIYSIPGEGTQVRVSLLRNQKDSEDDR
jgi:signal transduction histidine kinase